MNPYVCETDTSLMTKSNKSNLHKKQKTKNPKNEIKHCLILGLSNLFQNFIQLGQSLWGYVFSMAVGTIWGMAMCLVWQSVLFGNG